MGARRSFEIPRVRLEPHDTAWALEFMQQREYLIKLLANLPVRSIEHIGSTAIADLIAKPIIDLAIVIDSAQIGLVGACLVSAGYQPCPEHQGTGRLLFWQPGTADTHGHPADGRRKINTHVCLEGGLGIRGHRDLKRVLAEHTDLRKEYGNVKKILVERHDGDLTSYNGGKSAIIKKILQTAGGWTEEEMNIVLRRGEDGPRPGDWIVNDEESWFDRVDEHKMNNIPK